MAFKKTLEEMKALKKGGFNFPGAERLTIVWETNSEIIAELLPEPLKPAKKPIASAFVANYPSTDFGEPYLESALLLLADFNGEEGFYCLSMPVTDDMALIGGRLFSENLIMTPGMKSRLLKCWVRFIQQWILLCFPEPVSPKLIRINFCLLPV